MSNMMISRGVSMELVEYIERYILPMYDNFDKAHRRDHVDMVITQSMKLAGNVEEINLDMVYCVAAFHDVGLIDGRERHHISSGLILATDKFVNGYFSAEQIKVMKDAVEDHRASGKTQPRSIYGMIVADADRFIDTDTIVRRTIQYGLANYPELDRNGQYRRAISHLNEKYGVDGYLKVWLPWGDNAERLKQLRIIIENTAALTAAFNRIYEEEVNCLLFDKKI